MTTYNPINTTTKFDICGLPIRLDTYRECEYNCTYCFAKQPYIKRKNKTLNLNYLKNIFKKVYDDKEINSKNFLETLLKNRITLHGGGMSDCFQSKEEKYHNTTDVVTICNEYNQSILFSTKTDNLYYVPVNPELHSFQLSFSNLNNNKLEPNSPKIENRIKFFHQLKDEGYKVGIRVQPFIPNITNLEQILDTFHDADHFTIEGIKLYPNLNIRKQCEKLNISKLLFDKGKPYTLKKEIRLYHYLKIISTFEENNISYSIADNDLRYMSNNYCCCGDNLIKNSTTFNPTYLHKKYGHLYSYDNLTKETNMYTNCEIKNNMNIQKYFKLEYNKSTSLINPFNVFIC